MNILDYLETEFSSFENKSFNVVDSAILSQFCMVRCEGLVPAFDPNKPSRASQNRKPGILAFLSALTKIARTKYQRPSCKIHQPSSG